jgi:putative tricarboxylic transport membrane protein
LKKCDYPAAPMILALVLGPMMEKNIGQALSMSEGGRLVIFFSTPISAVLSLMIIFVLISPAILKLFKKKRPALLIQSED